VNFDNLLNSSKLREDLENNNERKKLLMEKKISMPTSQKSTPNFALQKSNSQVSSFSEISDNKMRIPNKLPLFRSKDKKGIQDVTEWCVEFRAICDMYEVPEDKLYKLVAPSLNPNDRNWYLNWLEEQERPSWETIVSTFEAHFGDAFVRTKYLTDLQEIKMKSNETVQEYSDKFTELVRRLKMNERSDDLKEKFLRGLRKDIATQASVLVSSIFVNPGMDSIKLSEYCDIALKAESIIRREHAMGFSHNNNRSLICYHCNKPGHKANDCRVARRENSNSEESKTSSSKPATLKVNSDNNNKGKINKSVTCYKCQEKGHIAPHCPLKEKKEIKQKMASVEQNIDKNESATGLHTPCFINGEKILAFIDGGATTSFIDEGLVKKLNLTVQPREGVIKQFLDGSERPRTGIVENINLVNGKKSLVINVEVGQLL